MDDLTGLSGTAEGRQLLAGTPSIVKNLCSLLNHEQKSVATDASLTLVNLSADENIAPLLLTDDINIINIMLDIISNPDHDLSDPACMALANLTHTTQGSEKIFQAMAPELSKYVDIFCQEKYNKKGANLHYLAGVFSNLSQIPAMRE